jgi:NADH:ubiquinone oxidoreductase subunit 2 (subunit N)
VSRYYYLLILKQALVIPRRAEDAPIATPLPAALSLLTAAAFIVWLGLFPSVILRLFG